MMEESIISISSSHKELKENNSQKIDKNSNVSPKHFSPRSKHKINSPKSPIEIIELNENSQKQSSQKSKKKNSNSQSQSNFSQSISKSGSPSHSGGEDVPSKAQKRKRRKRIELTGPSYKCPECGNVYYSTPALNTHRKAKHDYVNTGHGRGRPKREVIINPETVKKENKEEIDNNLSYSKIESIFSKFFETEGRKITDDKVDANKICEIMNDIKKNYSSLSERKNNNYIIEILKEIGIKSIEESFESVEKDNYNSIKGNNGDLVNERMDVCIDLSTGKQVNRKNKENVTSLCNNNASFNFKDTNKITEENLKMNFDFGLKCFIKKCIKNTNPNFLKILLSFLLLFRDGINKIFSSKDSKKIFEIEYAESKTKNEKLDNDKNSQLYTQINNCDNISDKINEVIENYFEPNSYFGLDNKDIIDIICYFFHWLYMNKFMENKVMF